MNYIKHLTGFFNKSNQDKTITPTHISLYLALFQRWNLNRFKNPIIISREEMMLASKIKSKGTYHKCMKELHNRNYIIYKPSYNPYEGTEVILPDLSILSDDITSPNFEQTESKNGLLKLKASSNFEQTESKNELLPQKKDKNALTSSNFERTEPKNELVSPLTSPKFERTVPKNGQHNEQVYIYNNKTLENNKTIYVPDEKKEIKKEKKSNEFSSPNLDVVKQFFQEKKISSIEAEKYFNYYSSKGWLVGGKTQMKDWQAAARNWILNLEKFNTTNSKNNLNPKNLNVSNSKDYAEPL
ncbi:transcriptional regulator [Flavobacterium sp. HJJ]|uniref:transcriptional regulator n=1 Tax=Flavobacterium sp. HJJ TaxID=2783792 RepID=UPI00188B098F|nr:transcriptional regulator [Flavobacterium sp. HJJ]MBF4473298.1 transcriptional regulator [Flavobacterium sp. HJJ]